MSAPAITVITPLGCVVIDGGVASQMLCQDLGITVHSIHVLGPYMVSLTATEAVSATLPASALQDCYVSARGYIVHSSAANCLCMGVTRVLSVWRAEHRYVLGCDGAGLVELRQGLFFRVCKFEAALARGVRVLELYNYNFLGEYQTVLFPSEQLLRDLTACCTHCLLHEDGWVVVDVRECELAVFLSALAPSYGVST